MLKFIRWVVPAAVAAMIIVAPLPAQQRSTVNSAALDAAVAARPADNRAVLTAAVSSPSAVAMAGRVGITPTQLAARVAALDDASAQQLADRVRAGGGTLVIGTTTVIIVLLLILLLR
jgi:hypothetical protein